MRGWTNEALIGNFVDGIKPWLASEVKMKQLQRLYDALKIAELLEETHYSEKKWLKALYEKDGRRLG